jgi:hypothetical protein
MLKKSLFYFQQAPAIQGRGAPILSILGGGKAKYTIDGDLEGEVFTSVITQHANDKATMFSVPALQDGDLKFSQSQAIINYLGKKLNMLPASEANQVRAQQYVGDIMDLFCEMLKPAFVAGDAKPASVKAAYKRMGDFSNLIDRQIKGPFYFGEKPCYVDYALAGVIASMNDLHKETFKVMSTPVTAKMTAIHATLKPSTTDAQTKDLPHWIDPLRIPQDAATKAGSM